jgi:hypothetical protein
MLSVVVALLFAAGPMDDAALRSAMASFDKGYVATLVLTKQGEAEAAKEAVEKLAERFKAFREACYEARPDDAQWKPDFDRAGKAIEEAQAAVAAGDVAGAHAKLDPLRKIFLELRARHNIEYGLDALTEFRETLEALLGSVKGKTPDSLGEADLAALRKQAERVRGAWVVVEKAAMDTDLFGFDTARSVAYREAFNAEKAALTRLTMALDRADESAVLLQSTEAGEAFGRLFRLYGDLPPQ